MMKTLQEFIETKKVGQQITSMTRLEALSIIQDTHKIMQTEGASLDIEATWSTGERADMVRAKRMFCLFNMLSRMSETELDMFSVGIKSKSVDHIIFRIAKPTEDGAVRIECKFVRKKSGK
jgi:hypothetical protein